MVLKKNLNFPHGRRGPCYITQNIPFKVCSKFIRTGFDPVLIQGQSILLFFFLAIYQRNTSINEFSGKKFFLKPKLGQKGLVFRSLSCRGAPRGRAQKRLHYRDLHGQSTEVEGNRSFLQTPQNWVGRTLSKGLKTKHMKVYIVQVTVGTLETTFDSNAKMKGFNNHRYYVLKTHLILLMQIQDIILSRP